MIAATGTGTIPANFTSLNISLRSSGSSMSVPSQLRSSYFNPSFNIQQHQQQQQQRRSSSLFPGIGLSSESTSTLLNFQTSSNLNTMLQAKQELRDATSSLDLSETTEESIGGRKRRQEQDLSPQSQHAAAPNGELFVAVYARAIPASHGHSGVFLDGC